MFILPPTERLIDNEIFTHHSLLFCCLKMSTFDDLACLATASLSNGASSSSIPYTFVEDRSFVREELHHNSRVFSWKFGLGSCGKEKPPHLRYRGNPGPQHIPINSTPTQIFMTFFSKTLFKKLVKHTNMYAFARKQTNSGFQSVCLSEMFTFIGYVVLNTVLKCKEFKKIWRSTFAFDRPNIRQFMTRDRFLFILWNLHISDPSQESSSNDEKIQSP